MSLHSVQFLHLYIIIYYFIIFSSFILQFIYNIILVHSYFLDPSDYTTTTQTISFTSGQSVGSTVHITIAISEDNFVENIESFFGSLSLLPNNLNVEVTPNRKEIFITDNDRKN